MTWERSDEPFFFGDVEKRNSSKGSPGLRLKLKGLVRRMSLFYCFIAPKMRENVVEDCLCVFLRSLYKMFNSLILLEK